MEQHIVQGKDGVYRWTYELSLYKNPTILFLIWKIFGWICFGIWAFTTLISVGDYGFWWEGFWDNTKIFLLVAAGMFVLSTIGYFLYALMMGGKYCAIFEMDENGVCHTQMQKQVKRAEAISLLTILVGIAAKRPATVGAGLMSSAKTSMYSDFAKVKSVKAYPRRQVIKVNAPFNKNQVYAEKENFDFVLRYICAHTNCKKNRHALAATAQPR
jgi:hypothetical protein